MGLRCRSLVARDPRNGHGISLRGKLALQFRHRILHPPRVPEHLLETLHHLRDSMRGRSYPSFHQLPGNGRQDDRRDRVAVRSRGGRTLEDEAGEQFVGCEDSAGQGVE